MMLLSCTVFLAGCSLDGSGNPSSSTEVPQNKPITPIGAQPTCLTVNTPSLVKLADGNYKLVDEIDNCGDKDAGPFKVTAQIGAVTTDLIGSDTIPAKGKGMYNTSTGQADKEIHFTSHASPVNITLSATMNGSLQGEWDGQVKIPA